MSSKENKAEKQEQAKTTDDKVEIERSDEPEVEALSEEEQGETTSEETGAEEENIKEASDSNEEEDEVPEEEESDSARADRLTQELAESKDKYVRLVAEFENFKRRNTQEMQSRFKFANQGLATSILSGLDSLERAIEQAQEEENDSLKEFVTGIEMAKQQFYEAFSKNNIERIVPTGELFDPNKHEAMGVVETDEVEPDHIAQVFQAGYLLHDRVVRPAMVQVAKKK